MVLESIPLSLTISIILPPSGKHPPFPGRFLASNTLQSVNLPALGFTDFRNRLLQVVGLLVVLFYPEVALWLPRVMFGG